MRTRKVTLTLLTVISFMILFMACPPEAEAASKLKTITVTKIDQQTAKKVHKQLLKGKKFKLRFRGGEKNFYKQFQKLSKKVANCTDEGFNIFPICMQDAGYYGTAGFDQQGNQPRKSGGYTSFLVKSGYCQEYIYGIKFAKREYEALKRYVDKILAKSRSTLKTLEDDTSTWLLSESAKRTYIKKLNHVISEYEELQQYLKRTKLRDLPGTMKARILLEIGGSVDANDWVKTSMKHKDMGFKRKNSFKDLYNRKAYGRELYIAHTLCKICAVYNIGDFSCVKESSQPNGVMVWVKMKTRSGKTRYGVYRYGTLRSTRRQISYETKEALVRYRKRRKSDRVIGQIAKAKTIRQQIAVDGINVSFGTTSGDAVNLTIYEFNLDRSEW
ncbi:hypothetical protein E5329_22320 [Petralouisia muris]|uniref:Uncharacterized protein n=1 Tax=Petralouisia muris TaxID=3032872 RepID=A0AC61RR29_9FIRM|nr:hypothetical protein [Petralouisia muris]TGY91205.1 hypothetical protein E5329_22320 [Petralouisia muris]